MPELPTNNDRAAEQIQGVLECAWAISSDGAGFSNFNRRFAALTLTRLPESSSTWAEVSASDRIRPARNLPASSNNACMGGIVPWAQRPDFRRSANGGVPGDAARTRLTRAVGMPARRFSERTSAMVATFGVAVDMTRGALLRERCQSPTSSPAPLSSRFSYRRFRRAPLALLEGEADDV